MIILMFLAGFVSGAAVGLAVLKALEQKLARAAKPDDGTANR